MVAKMKKLTFLIFHKDYEHFLHDLRELGMVHVVENKLNQTQSEQLEKLYMQWKQLSEAKKILEKYRGKKNPLPPNPVDIEKGYRLPREIEKIQADAAALTQQLQISKKERDALIPWGNFDPENISRLESAGYFIHFFVVANRDYNPEWEELYNAIVIETKSSKTYFITITKDRDIPKKLNLEAVKMPEVSLEQLNGMIDDLNAKLQENEEKLRRLTADLPSLEAAIAEIDSEIRFTRVQVSADHVADNKVMLLQGWVPESNEQDICNYLELKEVFYIIEDPQPEDDVPILLQNKKFARLFEPLTEMYTLPKYSELDLTPYFAPFYMIFFGLSLGDLGYGLFLFLAATVVKIIKKTSLGKNLKDILTLAQVLGASAFFCGLLTGGFFGFNIYEINIPFVAMLKEKIFLDNNKMFVLSLVLGVVQIMFGMLLKIFNRKRQFGFKYTLSTIGWFVLLLSIGIAVLLPTYFPLFGTAHTIVALTAGILIFFFNSPGKNPLFNFGLGLWDTYNMATGLLGDVLSYVRLFALGLSGGILASVFNSLAVGISPDNNVVIGAIVTVLIFVVGHGITIFMNTLGAIVHPMRLTFVEFYKNAEFTGGGKKYNPFKK
ncbi:MAG: V-type ATPase 116kDa subunit family protein [Dysgonamonadaceae bacterium]|nr:V-type ATPase 116kDa subunit family protein [Dysgonamonadaceae bacterium]